MERRVVTARAAVTWLAAAVVAVLVLASVEQIAHDSAPGPLLASLIYVLRVGLVAAVAGFALVLLPHVALERGKARPVALSAGAVALLGAYPAWRQAALLTSGDGISALSGVVVLRAGLFIAFVAGFVALFAWHRLRSTRPFPWWALPIEFAVLGGAFYVSSFRLRAYQFLAELLLVPLFVGLVTLVALGLRRTPRWAPVAILCVSLLAAFAPALMQRDYALARTAMVRNAPMLAHADVRLGLHPPPRHARFELDALSPADCRDATPAPAASSNVRPPRHVIFLTVDALRADVVWLDIKGRAVTPHLRAWAKSGVVFPRAITPYPATLLALGSALTGLSPAEIALSPRTPENLLSLVRPELPNQFVVLPDSRWFRMPVMDSLIIQGARVIFAGSSVEASAHAPSDPAAHEASPDGDARAATRFIAELEAARLDDRSAFAWLHLFAPHAPYARHPAFDFGGDATGRYLSEVAYADAQLGRVFEVLREDGWLDDSLVVLFADHGQALGERGYHGHHVYLDGYLTDVPLVIHAPGVPRAVRHDVASLVDVAPTVLARFGVRGVPGASGRDLLSGAALSGRAVLSEAFPVRGSRLFQLLEEPPEDAARLGARAEHLLSGERMYLPKVSVVTRERRLVVNRLTGLSELTGRSSSPIGQGPPELDDPSARASLLERLDALSRAQARAIYCRARQAWDHELALTE